jgi:hypothetical protein
LVSSFTWLDYSETERRKALEVIDLFRERDTRDELGIGTIRDAFADMLFPGTSTIQTRARYFLFIPWIFADLERRRVPSAQIAQRARGEEIRLIDALLKSGETDGVIGREVGRGLQRLPSDIYWLGMQTFGIRKFKGSREQYHRHLDRFYRWFERGNSELVTDEGSPVDGHAANWDPHLPPTPVDWRSAVSLRLTRQEATYLKDRIMASNPGSLLSHLVAETDFEQVGFVWYLPLVLSLPRQLQEQTRHARNFSVVVHGAALLYNRILAEKRVDEHLVEQYGRELSVWADRLAAMDAELQTWRRPLFWQTVQKQAQVSPRTRVFVDDWLDLVLDWQGSYLNAARIVDDASARRLIAARESTLKGPRARLHNQRALELWTGAAGTQQLAYRWPQAQRIVLDILGGLRGGDDERA